MNDNNCAPVSYSVFFSGSVPTIFMMTHIHDDVIKWKHFSALLALFTGNSPVTGHRWIPLTKASDVFFGVRPNKRLS